ncbi:hypothetical protein DRN50_05105 [Thermococci archaeon]|nr:MAG: hypothetical protein DRN50_05105 [Thermococci archaeon]
MIIIGVDGADYYITKNYIEVNHLEVDLEPKHTATIWTSYFSGLLPEEHKIRSWKPVLGRPADVDFIWNHGDWTVFAAPVCMPPVSIKCTTSDYHMKAEESAWETELKEFKECYDNFETPHFAGVIRCIDCASHAREKEVVLPWYERVFSLIEKLDFDVLISDHGFSVFNRRQGEKDHSPNGIIRGVNVKKASEFVAWTKKAMKKL